MYSAPKTERSVKSKRALIVLLFLALDVLFLLFVFDRFYDPASSSAREVERSKDSGDPLRRAPSGAAAEVTGDARSAAVRGGAGVGAGSALEATLVVRVVAESSQRPLAGVRIALESRDLTQAAAPVPVDASTAVLGQSPITDANGEVRVGVPAGVELDLEATSATADAGSAAFVVTALEKGERRAVVVELPSGDDLRVCGLVLDAADKTPIAGADVHVLSAAAHAVQAADAVAAPASSERVFAASTTDAQGRFALALAAWRDPYLRVGARGFGLALADVGPGHETADRPLVFRLRRGAAIEARIVDEIDQPIPGARVRAYVEAYRLQTESAGPGGALVSAANVEWTGISAADGTCTLEDLVPETALTVQVGEASRVRCNFEVAALAPGERRSVDWTVNLGCTLAATLVDEREKPVARCEVWVFRAEDERPGGIAWDRWTGLSRESWRGFSRDQLTATKTTDDAGRFTLRDVPGGSWYIGPAPGRRRGTSDDIVAQGELVEIARGVRNHDVVIHARRGTYIRGRVVDPSGTPPARFNVTLRPIGAAHGGSTPKYFARSEDELNRGIYARTGPGATFELGPLAPGEFELTATGYHPIKDSLPVKITARSGDENLLLQLKPLGFIAGRVIDAGTGEPVRARVRVSPVLHREVWSSTEQGFTVAGLYSGTYTLVATTPDGRIGLLRDVAVESGSEMRGLDVAVQRGGRLRIHYKGSRADCFLELRAGQVVIAGPPVSANGVAIETVPAGDVSIRLQAKDGRSLVERDVRVSAGEEQRVELAEDR